MCSAGRYYPNYNISYSDRCHSCLVLSRYRVMRRTPTTYRNEWKCPSQYLRGGLYAAIRYGNRVVLHTARNNNRPTVILKINNDRLPSEYIGLPPCLQALHPGIPDETNATRSIIRSLHVMIISRGKGGRNDYANYDAITICSSDCRFSWLPVNYALDLNSSHLHFRGLRFRRTSDFRSDHKICLRLDS